MLLFCPPLNKTVVCRRIQSNSMLGLSPNKQSLILLIKIWTFVSRVIKIHTLIEIPEKKGGIRFGGQYCKITLPHRQITSPQDSQNC